MKVFSLTKTLDKYVDFYIDDPSEADVIVVGGSKIELELYPKLKFIFKCGVGKDRYEDLSNTKVKLIMPSDKTKNAITHEVACFAMSSILRGFYQNSGNVYDWSKKERSSISDSNALIIGANGAIGSQVAHTCRSFFDNVVSYDINTNLILEEEVRKADIISLHIPLTDTTRNIVKFDWLKKEVILVNTSRGAIFDEDKLYTFLIENPNATAFFDVFWVEPYKGRLLDLPNFIASPHIASCSDAFTKGLYKDLTGLL